ncbi:MAG: hypothetical protein QOE14_2052 [Humisphaera sp.]|nr:hypothetical protein [Humisphaera sp.]
MVSMNKLGTADRVRVVAALVEGCSIRATVRMTGVAKNTVAKLLVDLGTACADYHDKHVRGVNAKRIQADEIWAFVYAKQKNVKKPGEGHGDCWTWTAIDADSKLMISYLVGDRGTAACNDFMDDVASRVVGRPQVTTDSYFGYFKAVLNAFNGEVDHAVLQKVYGPSNERSTGGGRYSPPVCTGIQIKEINGAPDRDHISTSYVERQNLTMRMGIRRFTRLTNAFSKKVANHAAAVALHFMHYNFCRVHQTLRVTPAMEAGLADHVWTIEELVALLDRQ